MDNLKKMSANAGTLFSRAKQYTEEKLGSSEKTEYDEHYDNLVQRSEKTRIWTEKILKQTESVLQPNPSVRIEELFYDKLDRKKTNRTTNNEALGEFMINAGNDFGPSTPYGSALVKCGQAEQKLGVSEKEFVAATAQNFLQPLRSFLEGDMKTVQKERSVLGNKRLDLDAAKSRLRRIKNQSGTESAEADLRVAQEEFNRQAEVTRLLLEGVGASHSHHLRCLHDLVEAQTNYYAQCHQTMLDLQRDLGSVGCGGVGTKLGGSTSPTIHFTSSPKPSAPPSQQRARVLYDYDAVDSSELTLKADEMITVESIVGLGEDWVMATRAGNQRGKVPSTYIELMD